jgi:hypothetical protein
MRPRPLRGGRHRKQSSSNAEPEETAPKMSVVRHDSSRATAEIAGRLKCLDGNAAGFLAPGKNTYRRRSGRPTARDSAYPTSPKACPARDTVSFRSAMVGALRPVLKRARLNEPES